MSTASSKSQALRLGIFILASLALAIFLLLSFGSSRWQRNAIQYRLYFNTSVKGLTQGSPVMFQGIKIGQVRDIHLSRTPRHNLTDTSAGAKFPIEVIVDISPDRLGFVDKSVLPFRFGPSQSEKDARKYLEDMIIQENLRGMLQTASLLTGQLYIELTFCEPEEDETHSRISAILRQGIIPSRRSMLEKMFERLGQKDFNTNIDSLYQLVGQIGAFISSGKSEQLLADLSAIAANLRTSSDTVKKDLPEMLAALRQTVGKLDTLVTTFSVSLAGTVLNTNRTIETGRKTLLEVNAILKENRSRLSEIGVKLTTSLDAVQRTLDKAHQLIEHIDQGAKPDSQLNARIDGTLRECQEAAAKLRELLDMLSQNPQALILGR
jgi:paraquat-inducible protein B